MTSILNKGVFTQITRQVIWILQKIDLIDKEVIITTNLRCIMKKDLDN